MKATITITPKYVDRHPTETPLHLIFHRPLTPTEVRTIWAFLDSSRVCGEHQELHLTVRRENNGQLTGWVTQTADRSIQQENLLAGSLEPTH
jgi:hypothetical protein